MKQLFVLMVLTGFCFEAHSQNRTDKYADVSKVAWLEGTWQRTNTKANRTSHERWLKKSATEMNGFGVTMSGSDTMFIEKLKIIVKEGNLFYVADVPENKQPVFFKITELTIYGFTCENPQHDFPKKITYQKQGDNLKATISAGDKAIDYFFVKAN